MRIHQAELLTNIQLKPFMEKGGNRLSNNYGISLCLCKRLKKKRKRKSLSTHNLTILDSISKKDNMLAGKVQLVILILFTKHIPLI